MLEAEVHDGFLHFKLPQQTQEYLNEVDDLLLDDDGAVIPGQLEKVEPPNVKSKVMLFNLSWPEEKKKAARRLVMEMNHVEQWFENDITDVGMQGKDAVLQEGSLTTSAGRRHIYLPRPFPVKEEAKAVIRNKLTESEEVVDWKVSDAYVLVPGSSIAPWGQPIRAYVLRLLVIGKEKLGNGGTRATEGDDKQENI